MILSSAERTVANMLLGIVRKIMYRVSVTFKEFNVSQSKKEKLIPMSPIDFKKASVLCHLNPHVPRCLQDPLIIKYNVPCRI